MPGKEEANYHVKGVDWKGNKYDEAMPIPFCGGAGRVLHRMLNWADIREGEFILTNVCKNMLLDGNKVRTPTEAELVESRPQLILEICKIDPNLIITLGLGPIWSLCYFEKESREELRMGKLNGTHHKLELSWFDNKIHTYTVLPLYHPSAVQRDETGERGYKEAVTKVMIDNKEMIGECIGRIML